MVKKQIYLVEALRYNDRNNHNYIVGIYSSLQKAKKAKTIEELNRGGKYTCVISKISLDEVPEDLTK